jgi:SAM-dependent methyltransferase
MANTETICDICGSTRSEVLFEIPDLWTDRMNISALYYKCPDCGLVFQSPKPSSEDLKIYYPDNYEVFHNKSNLLNKFGLWRRFGLIQRYKSKGILLDVGSAQGNFLNYIISNKGWEGIGLETNQKAAENARQVYGLNIINDQIENADFMGQTFDVITLWDVLEHLTDPSSVLKKLRNTLKPDGILVLRLPNLSCLDAKWFGKCWAGYDSPRHLFVFTIDNLEILLKQTGYKIKLIYSNIGGYLNFVKSLDFYMKYHLVNPNLRKSIIKVLRSIPIRIIAFPVFWVKDRMFHGSEIVVIAEPNAI